MFIFENFIMCYTLTAMYMIIGNVCISVFDAHDKHCTILHYYPLLIFCWFSCCSLYNKKKWLLYPSSFVEVLFSQFYSNYKLISLPIERGVTSSLSFFFIKKSVFSWVRQKERKCQRVKSTAGWVTTKRDIVSLVQAAHSSWKNHSSCHRVAGISQDVRSKLVLTEQDFGFLLFKLIWIKGIDLRRGRLSLLTLWCKALDRHKESCCCSIWERLQGCVRVTSYWPGIYRTVKVQDILGNIMPRGVFPKVGLIAFFFTINFH